MMLLVDAGNSRLKWAFCGARGIEAVGSLERGRQVAAAAKKAWGNLEIPPDRVVVACVAGASVRRALGNWFGKQWALTPEYLRAQSEACGVRNAYAEPERLGVDRWAALIAVYSKRMVPACIIDCGTAITIDALAADGQHLGGLIAPGLVAMRECLVQRAEQIDAAQTVASGDESSLLASDTGNAIVGGSLYAAVSMIDRVVVELGNELGSRMHVLITGGDAQQIIPLLESSVDFEPDLVLQGMAVLAAEQNGSISEPGREQEAS